MERELELASRARMRVEYGSECKAQKAYNFPGTRSNSTIYAELKMPRISSQAVFVTCRHWPREKKILRSALGTPCALPNDGRRHGASFPRDAFNSSHRERSQILLGKMRVSPTGEVAGTTACCGERAFGTCSRRATSLLN